MIQIHEKRCTSLKKTVRELLHLISVFDPSTIALEPTNQQRTLPESFPVHRSKKETTPELILRLVDKPNVHHLWELVCSQLYICRGAAFLNELSFEKHHQFMRHAVINSNQRETYIQAISHARFQNWKLRIYSNIFQHSVTKLDVHRTACNRLLSRFEDATAEILKYNIWSLLDYTHLLEPDHFVSKELRMCFHS